MKVDNIIMAAGNSTSSVATPTVTTNSEANYDNVTLLLTGDTDVDTNFANVSLLLDGNNLADKSNNKFSISNTGSVSVSNSVKKFGTGSMYFSGSNTGAQSTMLSISSTSVLNISSGDFTIEFWFNTVSLQNYSRMLMFNSTYTTDSVGVYFDTSTNKVGFFVYNTGVSLISIAAPSFNTWHHIAITRSGSTFTLWLNGVSQQTVTNSSAMFNTSTPYVTVGNGDASAGGFSPFTGYIDDLRITNGVARYTANFIPPIKALPTHTIVDSSVYNIPLTIAGSPKIDNTIKKYGTGSMYFNGGSYINVPASTNWVTGTTSSLTIECWFYPTVAQYSYIMDQPTGNASAIAINFGSTGSDYINVYNGGYTAQIPNITLPVNQWTHFAFVLNSGVPTVYVNGILQTGTYTSNRGWGVNQPIHIGQYAGGGYNFTGHLDDFRITKGIARYTANFTPPTASLPTVPPTISADPWWGNVSLLLDGNTTDAYDPYWQNVSLMLTGDDFIDWSTKHSTLTNNGSVTLSTASKKFNSSSYSFTGATGSQNAITGTGLTAIGTGNFTVEFWVNFSNTTNEQQIFDLGSTGFTFYIVSNALHIQSRVDGADITIATLTTGTWYFIQVTRTGTAIATYVNGTAGGTGTISSNFTSTSFTLGSRYAAYSANWYGVNAYIADLRLTTGIARTITVPTAALPSYKIQDRTQNNLTLTPYGNVQLSTDVMKNGTGSMFFDGSGDYVKTSASSNLCFGTGDFTIELWYYPLDRVSGYPQIVNNSTGWGANAITLCDRHGDVPTKFTFDMYNYANGRGLVSNATVVNGVWVHLAVVRSGTNIALYINGVLDNSITTSVNVDGGGSTFWCAGAENGNSNTFLNGYIDDLRITKGYARYTQNFTPPSQSLPNQYISTGYDANYADVSLLLNGNGTNGSTTFTDLSSSPKTITVAATTISTAVKKYGTGAMYFDGGNTRLNVTTHANLNLTDDFTIEFWMYPLAAVSNYPVVITTGDGSVSIETSIIYNYPNSGINFSVADGKSITGSAPSENNWHHIVVSRQGTTTRMFIDGIKVGTDITAAYTFTQSKNWYIGDRQANASGANYPFKGYIDDLRITKGIARYTTNFTPPTYQLPTDTTGTVIDPLRSSTSLLLRGNGTNGSTSFTDESPNGLTVTNTGSVTVNTTTKKYGTGSMYFSSNNYLSLAANSVFGFGTGDITVECWIYPTAISSYPIAGFICDFRYGGGNCALFIASNTVYWYNGAAEWSGGSITTNSWQHIAVTRAQGKTKMFINGVQQWSNTDSANYGTSCSPCIGIRYDLSTSPFNGYIDDLRVTKGYARYTANFTPPTYEDPIVAGAVLDYNYPQVSLLLNGDGTNGSQVFTDLSGTPKAITAYGNTQVSTSVKKFGTGSMYFDGGSSSYLTVTGLPALGTSDFTIEFWLYRSASPVNQYSGIFNMVANTSSDWTFINGGINISLDASNTGLGFGYSTGGGTPAGGSASVVPISATTWTHIAVVRLGTLITIYKDGVNTTTCTLPANFNVVTDGKTVIGRHDIRTTFNLTGYIDDLRITKGVARYTANFTPPTTQLPTSYS